MQRLQTLLSRMRTRLMKSWSWTLLILLTILIKWVSWYPSWVEDNYSRKFYPFISKIQRFLLGWIPLSVGDILYGILVLLILYKTVRFFKALFKKRITRKYFISGLQQVIFFFLFLYVFFNLLWGLNYNRKGIASQLGLNVKTYSLGELDTLTTLLQDRLNAYADLVDEAARDSFDKKKNLFTSSVEAFAMAGERFPFLKYSPRCIKPSIYSYLGNYLGFQGYYNPFSGEGQVNTTIPRFLEPFVTTHEIAHQLGYAKENEANFVGFLACRHYDSPIFRYSTYWDLYNYAIVEVADRDSVLARSFNDKLKPQVKKDIREYKEFYRRYKNKIEPVIMWFYGKYLKANNQPAGKRSYNEVVAWLIAYYKKFGIEAI